MGGVYVTYVADVDQGQWLVVTPVWSFNTKNNKNSNFICVTPTYKVLYSKQYKEMWCKESLEKPVDKNKENNLHILQQSTTGDKKLP